jgi:O-antigen ligase
MFTQYGLILFFSSFVIDYIASERWKKSFRLDATRVVSIFILLQFVLLFVFSFFEVEPRYLSTLYEYRTAFIGFGIIGLLGISDKFRVRHFAYATLISAIVLCVSVYFDIPESFSQLTTIQAKLDILRQTRATNICSHMTINLFLCAGMALFCKVFTLSNSSWEKAFSIFAMIIYFAMIMLSEGRVGMLSGCILMGFILLRASMRNLRLLIPMFTIFVVICLSGFLIATTNNPIKSKISALNKSNPREYIWKEGINKIKESPIVGVGASTNAAQLKEILLNNEDLIKTEKFLLDHLREDKVYGMHPHNQIMQSWLEYGLLGLFVILGLFISILLAIKGSLTLSLIFIAIFVQLQTEVIDGGITTVGFCTYIYLILVLLKSKQMGKEKISSLKWIFRSPSNA